MVGDGDIMTEPLNILTPGMKLLKKFQKDLEKTILKRIEESDPYIIGPTYAASPTWAVRVETL